MYSKLKSRKQKNLLGLMLTELNYEGQVAVLNMKEGRVFFFWGGKSYAKGQFLERGHQMHFENYHSFYVMESGGT